MEPGTDLVIGIDEAGRGPILGPMVIACVALSTRQGRALSRAGVVDSKEFGAGPAAHAARAALLPRILEHCAYSSIDVIDVAEIDRRTRLGELNRLEQERADLLLTRAPPARRIIADGARLFGPLCARYPHLQAVDQAESRHVAVAAASILAKTRRDELWQKIARRYEPEFGPLALMGGGYMNPATRRFLRAFCERYQDLPPEGRRSWPWTFVADLVDLGARGVARQMSLFSRESGEDSI